MSSLSGRQMTHGFGVILTVIWLAMTSAHAEPPATVHHDLRVQLDPATRHLQVEDAIELHAQGMVRVHLGVASRIRSAQLDGRALSFHTGEDGFVADLDLSSPARPHRLALEYEATLADLIETDHRGTLGALPAMASPTGSYLPAGSGWYATISDLPFTYQLRLDLPAGQRGLVPGRMTSESDDASGYSARFEFAHPIDGIDLMAGPFEVSERMKTLGERQVRLRTWFHPQIAQLSSGYLDSVDGYIRYYDGRIGAYPFSEFSVVSSPLPTGFGMPGLTYLGIDVLRLPFIRTTSLGHEVLHNWWGNGGYADYASGNWAEGLTTFMADYAYKEQESAAAAREMRLEWLRDFAAVPAGQDQPLRAFTARTHGTSQIVGYHKAAFVFFMLRDTIGAQAFDTGLRSFWQQHRFTTASWLDLRRSFEAVSGRDLGAFFEQWLNRAGAPQLSIEQASVDGHALALTLSQSAPPYALDVPLAITTDAGVETRVVAIDQAHTRAALTFASTPRQVALDPDLRLFRKLAPQEIPPILRNVMVNPATRLEIASSDPAFTQTARTLAQRLLDHPARTDASDTPSSPLLIIAEDARVAALLASHALPTIPAEVNGKGSARVWCSRLTSGQTLVVITAHDTASLAALERALPHYGRQSWLVFDGSKAIERGIWRGSPQVIELSGQTPEERR